MRLAIKRLDRDQSIYLQAPSDTATEGWIFCAEISAMFEAVITIGLMLFVAGVLWLRPWVDDYFITTTDAAWCQQQ
jgi:hypothetical protein